VKKKAQKRKTHSRSFKKEKAAENDRLLVGKKKKRKVATKPSEEKNLLRR